MKSDLNFKNLDLPSIKIVKTTPKVSTEELFSHKRCYFGISLDNPHFFGRSLQALMLWGMGNFDQCLVLVGDYLRRFNEQIFSGMSKGQAIQMAHSFGDAFMDRTRSFFEQLPARRVTLRRWEICLETSEYVKSRAALDDLFNSEPEFRASVEKDAFSFIKRQTKHHKKLAVTMEEALELSCRYLLEEIAVFSSLSQQGWKVELYPGPELNVLVDIAKGNFKDVPAALKERINVELKISEKEAKTK